MIINDPSNDQPPRQYRPREKANTQYITLVTRPGGVDLKKICCMYCGKRICDTERDVTMAMDGRITEDQGSGIEIKCSYCGVIIRVV